MRKILSIVLVVLLSACANKTINPDGEEGNQANKGNMSGENTSGSPTVNPLVDPTNILSKRSIYF